MRKKIEDEHITKVVRIIQIFLVLVSVFLVSINKNYLSVIPLLVAGSFELIIQQKYNWGFFGDKKSLFLKSKPAWIENLLIFIFIVIMTFVVFNL